MIKQSHVLLIIACIFFSCNPNPGKEAKMYSMFRGDNKHSAKYHSSEIRKSPDEKWKFKTGGATVSSATILGDELFFGSNDSSVYCLDKNSGKEKWSYKTGGAVCSTPAVTSKLVYVMSYDGNFYAINKSDGKLNWEFKTDGEKCFSAPGIHGRQPRDSVFTDDWDFYLSSPALDDSSVYFGTGSGYFYSLDKNSGTLKWKYKTGGVIHCSPAIAFNRVYFGSWDSFFYALDKNSGSEMWKTQTGIDTVIYNQVGFQGSPVIVDSIGYIGCRDSYMYAFNVITGHKIWSRFNDHAWVSSTPAISGDKIIYTTGDTRSVVILNRYTGDLVQETLAPGWMLSSPAVAGDMIYVGDIDGILSEQNLNDKNGLWRIQLSASRADKYKILNKDLTLNLDVVFDPGKRKSEGKTSMEMIQSLGSVLSSPVIEDGKIYVGSTDGYFYCLE